VERASGREGLLHVKQDVRERIDCFATLLERWNATVNLVAPTDIPTLRSRHIDDSLQLVSLIPPHTDRAIDLGSGGGFPGLVLSIATGIPFDLIESDRRKAAFLREAAREAGAPATVHAVRIEGALLPPAPLVTARALARLPRLLALAQPLLAPAGTCLFLKGAGVADELTEAATQWHMRIERWPSRTDKAAAILRISEIARVGTT
jgi:16S rRNA (guanine527-N7)-methyltransferase